MIHDDTSFKELTSVNPQLQTTPQSEKNLFVFYFSKCFILKVIKGVCCNKNYKTFFHSDMKYLGKNQRVNNQIGGSSTHAK